jgi:hypothetical protein
MAQNQQHADEQARQELRDTIRQYGWKDTTDLVTDVIEFVVDLRDTGHLSVREIPNFSHDMQVIINTLWEFGDGSYDEEVRRLREAVPSFNCAMASWRDVPPKNDGREHWSLYKAMAWREYLHEMRRFYKMCCDSWWRHFRPASREHREAALKCIEEIEKRIPSLHSARWVDVPAQRAALEQILLLNAKLTVYADHSKPLLRCSNSIVPATGASDRIQRIAAFCRILIGADLAGQEDWLEQVDSLRWVQAETNRLASQYDNDGRLDSNGRVVHERAYIDPLYEDTGDVRASGAIDEYSRAVAEHPNVHMEIENLDAVLKEAGLNPGQRRALLLRRNGKIMSRKDFTEWKRGQRAIRGNRSNLVKAITAATKKRVIKAPLISGGSYSGVIREGAGYTLPLPDDQKPTQNLPAPDPEAIRWFDSAPPPISYSHRKTKHLFKKMST